MKVLFDNPQQAEEFSLWLIRLDQDAKTHRLTKDLSGIREVFTGWVLQGLFEAQMEPRIDAIFGRERERPLPLRAAA